MTRLAPIEVGYVLNSDLPVIPLALEVSPRQMGSREVGCAAAHAHPRGQLIHAASGVLRVICGGDVWIAPPSQAVWVPADLEHEVYFPCDVALISLFIDPSAMNGLPERCAVLKVTPFLRELILRAGRIGTDYGRETAEWRVMQVLLDELRAAGETPLHLPMAADGRVRRVMEALMKQPGDVRGLEAWGALAGASGRTLARLFVSETGLTFGEWRKRLVLHEALVRLDRGEQVTAVALDLGYGSVSAFIGMFRRELGVSPGRYGRLSTRE